jgi:hypothetical protein
LSGGCIVEKVKKIDEENYERKWLAKEKAFETRTAKYKGI